MCVYMKLSLSRPSFRLRTRTRPVHLAVRGLETIAEQIKSVDVIPVLEGSVQTNPNPNPNLNSTVRHTCT